MSKPYQRNPGRGLVAAITKTSDVSRPCGIDQHPESAASGAACRCSRATSAAAPDRSGAAAASVVRQPLSSPAKKRRWHEVEHVGADRLLASARRGCCRSVGHGRARRERFVPGAQQRARGELHLAAARSTRSSRPCSSPGPAALRRRVADGGRRRARPPRRPTASRTPRRRRRAATRISPRRAAWSRRRKSLGDGGGASGHGSQVNRLAADSMMVRTAGCSAPPGSGHSEKRRTASRTPSPHLADPIEHD